MTDLIALAEHARLIGLGHSPTIPVMRDIEAALREAHELIGGQDELLAGWSEQWKLKHDECERLRALLQRFYDDGYDRQACGAALGEKHESP